MWYVMGPRRLEFWASTLSLFSDISPFVVSLFQAQACFAPYPLEGFL